MLIAIGVAMMQYYLQRQQQKQNLFDKRFQVYKQLNAYTDFVTHSNGDMNMERFATFLTETAPATFLFGSDVENVIAALTEMVSKAGEEYEGLEYHQGVDPTFIIDSKRLPLFRDCLILVKTIEDAFRPYLKLHHDKRWLNRLFAPHQPLGESRTAEHTGIPL
jgi:hypothetical protein